MFARWIWILFLWSGFASQAFSQGKAFDKTACQQEIQKFCSAEKSDQDIIKCLVKNKDQASSRCAEKIAGIIQAYKAHKGLSAFSDIMGGMSFGSSAPILNYGGSITPGAKAASSVEQHRLNVSVPVYTSGDHSFALSLGTSSLHFGEAPVLSDSGTQVPRDFYKIEVGGQYARKLDEDRNFGLRVSVGSASDTPFASGRDMTFSANTFYSYPGSETSHWVLSLFVSNNNPIANYLPIPGFIYFYRTENFIGMFGLPLASILWTPIDPWALSFSIFGPSMNLEILYGSRARLQGFAGLSWTQLSYLRHDRTSDDDRVFLDEKKAVLGMRAPFSLLSENLFAELQGGYDFDRALYEGPRFDKRDGGTAHLASALFIAWNFRYNF